MLYPENIEQKIGFDKIRELIKTHCASALGKEEIDKLVYQTNIELIRKQLHQVDEFAKIITQETDDFPMGSVPDLRGAMKRTRVDGTFMLENELFDLMNVLETLRNVTSYFKTRQQELYPYLIELAAEVQLFPEVAQRIGAILTKFGEIKDNASPQLAQIRRAIMAAQSSVSRTLQAILRRAQADGLVEKDVAPTMRDGRLVIPIAVMHKRKIGGIIHDESATGKTAFVEPTEVVEINNQLRELEGDERREIIRILTELTAFTRPFYADILLSLEFLAEVDALRAKARFALQIRAIMPQIDEPCLIEWHEARHPLLQLALEKQHKQIVPLNIHLDEKQRILLISGPNAGGKSVCLKTVALLQYMVQCGLLVPFHEISRMGIFESIFMDIGDEQSIENDLSTYSSHLLNMKQCVRYSNQRSLLLIDEFGTGTEPTIGGAIAEALLGRFNEQGAFGVITTHYNNLKLYASNHEGVVNGAMLYDRHEMQPLFSLQIGNPGSSFAIEIARKIGLPESVIQEASEKVGVQQVDFDKFVQDIARDKRYWERKRQQVREREKKMSLLNAELEEKLAQQKQREREIIKQAKQEAATLLSTANAKIEKAIRDIKESSADKEVAKQARAGVDELKKQVTEPKQKNKPTNDHPIAVGDSVTVKGQSVLGEVIELKNKQAVVLFGQIKSSMNVNKLEFVSKTKAKQSNKQKASVAMSTVDEVRERGLNFIQQLDLRGMRADEALQALIYYIDDAQVVGVLQVRILHGTGTGALRTLVRDYLQMHSGVKSFRDEHVQFGGAGITVVEMK